MICFQPLAHLNGLLRESQKYGGRFETPMASKGGVPLVIPSEIWQPLAEVRAQLDALCPGLPTPIEEALREIIVHYKRCPRTEDEAEAFCERAKAWKTQRRR